MTLAQGRSVRGSQPRLGLVPATFGGQPLGTAPLHGPGGLGSLARRRAHAYADDLAALTAHLDLKNAIHVGHSTGGGEVAHYLGRHGESRVAKAALISRKRNRDATGFSGVWRSGSA